MQKDDVYGYLWNLRDSDDGLITFRMRDLCDTLGLVQPRVSQLINELESDGLLERVARGSRFKLSTCIIYPKRSIEGFGNNSAVLTELKRVNNKLTLIMEHLHIQGSTGEVKAVEEIVKYVHTFVDLSKLPEIPMDDSPLEVEEEN
jgi:hypothetical protein